MIAREWLHANHKRLVTVKFGPDASISTVDRKGQKLRTFNLKSVDSVTVEKTPVCTNLFNKPDELNSCQIHIFQDHFTRQKSYVLLRQTYDHDLVLEFENSANRKFLKKLEDFLSLHKKEMHVQEVPSEVLQAKAETKERRQKRLEFFFREAYALTFGLRYELPLHSYTSSAINNLNLFPDPANIVAIRTIHVTVKL